MAVDIWPAREPTGSPERGDVTLSVFRPVSSRATGMAAKKTRTSARSPLERLRKPASRCPAPGRSYPMASPRSGRARECSRPSPTPTPSWGGTLRGLVQGHDATQDMSIARSPEVYFSPPNAGASGWVGIYLDAATDWTEVVERLRHAHELAAPPRVRGAKGRAAPRHVQGREMASERQKMLAGELYDPLDPELVAARERARDLCQRSTPPAKPRHDERRRILRELFAAAATRSGCSRPSSATTARTSSSGQGLLQLQLRRARRLPRPHRRLHAVRPGGADLHAHPSAERRTAAASRSSASRSTSGRMSGSAAGRSSARRDHRLADRHRRRQRRHTRHPGRRLRRRQPLPRHPRDHRVTRPRRIGHDHTVIRVDAVRKTYGRTVAVDDVSFDVQPGEIFGLIGPNGAGKTTTMECVEGLRAPDRGTISVLGLDPVTGPLPAAAAHRRAAAGGAAPEAHQGARGGRLLGLALSAIRWTAIACSSSSG